MTYLKSARKDKCKDILLFISNTCTKMNFLIKNIMVENIRMIGILRLEIKSNIYR